MQHGLLLAVLPYGISVPLGVAGGFFVGVAELFGGDYCLSNPRARRYLTHLSTKGADLLLNLSKASSQLGHIN
jgi:hypothetical protein